MNLSLRLFIVCLCLALSLKQVYAQQQIASIITDSETITGEASHKASQELEIKANSELSKSYKNKIKKRKTELKRQKKLLREKEKALKKEEARLKKELKAKAKQRKKEIKKLRESGEDFELVKLADEMTEEEIAELPDLERKRIELKRNEKKALDFIFPNIEDDSELKATEEFFSQTEKEQLLELWRATLVRNRTIQFIIKALTPNPDEIEKNNAVMQALSKAVFVPFYAVSAIADNALINSGAAAGARVVGDVVKNVNKNGYEETQIKKTDLIVMFMLVDEVAERLRKSYYQYKEASIEKALLKHELIPARIDAAEALQADQGSSVYFTRMVVRDIERRLRSQRLDYESSKRTLVELAGENAINSVDVLMNLEVEKLLSNVTHI